MVNTGGDLNFTGQPLMATVTAAGTEPRSTWSPSGTWQRCCSASDNWREHPPRVVPSTAYRTGAPDRGGTGGFPSAHPAASFGGRGLREIGLHLMRPATSHRTGVP